MPPKILLKFHAAVIKEIPLDKTPLTIGRKPDNDIVIDNMAVSSHHARIIMQGNTYVIEDTQSTNGTFLNDKKIINSGLKHNDTVAIGQHALVFVDPESAKTAPPAPAPAQPMNSEATVVITPQMMQQRQAAAASTDIPGQPPPKQQQELVGILRAIEGKAEQPEYILTGLLTYIGKSESAAIKIKGLFAPDIAALVSKRPTGYIITAVKEGYPKLNNQSLTGQADLKDNDLVEVGGIKFLFQMKEAKPNA